MVQMFCLDCGSGYTIFFSSAEVWTQGLLYDRKAFNHSGTSHQLLLDSFVETCKTIQHLWANFTLTVYPNQYTSKRQSADLCLSVQFDYEIVIHLPTNQYCFYINLDKYLAVKAELNTEFLDSVMYENDLNFIGLSGRVPVGPALTWLRQDDGLEFVTVTEWK